MVSRSAKKQILIFSLVSIVLFFSSGCTFLRKHISRDRGILSLRVKRGFGEGKGIKEYYITEREEIINLFDVKERIIDVLGKPDSMIYSLEGHEVWTYKAEKLKIYFTDDYVSDIREL